MSPYVKYHVAPPGGWPSQHTGHYECKAGQWPASGHTVYALSK